MGAHVRRPAPHCGARAGPPPLRGERPLRPALQSRWRGHPGVWARARGPAPGGGRSWSARWGRSAAPCPSTAPRSPSWPVSPEPTWVPTSPRARRRPRWARSTSRCDSTRRSWTGSSTGSTSDGGCSTPSPRARGRAGAGDGAVWPEHFDAATALDLGAGAGVNLGFSGGDAFCEEPYAYVGPWGPERPGDPAYWNAPFGAFVPRARAGDVADCRGVPALGPDPAGGGLSADARPAPQRRDRQPGPARRGGDAADHGRRRVRRRRPRRAAPRAARAAWRRCSRP